MYRDYYTVFRVLEVINTLLSCIWGFYGGVRLRVVSRGASLYYLHVCVYMYTRYIMRIYI